MSKSPLATLFACTAAIYVTATHLPLLHADESANAQFCKETGFYTSSEFSPKDFANIQMTEDGATETAGRFGNMMCTGGKVTGRDKIMAIRASWMKSLGIDERDFVVLAALSNARTYENQNLSSIAGPVSQIGNGYAAAGLVELDALGANASMFARFTVVDRCLQSGAERSPLLRHILCTREQLDPTKAYAELDATAELNNGTRYRLRRLVRKTAEAAAKRRAELDALAKTDPGVAKVIAIADAQFKEW
ncbi:MAG TPA: hypothetical protein VFV99_23610, partial [Kofleriaceae bacterium]|nr:hypothetical protein [Kofleriaceae bacterium]